MRYSELRLYTAGHNNKRAAWLLIHRKVTHIAVTHKPKTMQVVASAINAAVEDTSPSC